MLSRQSPLSILFAIMLFSLGTAAAQELEPRAYSVSPTGVNMLLLSLGHNGGAVTFDPALPVEDASASINTSAVAYGRTFGVAGRLANLGVVLPYSVGRLEGTFLGSFTQLDRSGMRDPLVRFAMNLVGAPAMNLREFSTYRQKTNLGFSLTVAAPLGQYDPGKVINIGANRWSFKPELGLSHAAGKWMFDLYGGAWLFTRNSNFLNGGERTQKPIGSFQFHLIRTLRPRTWIAFDANFYTGGRTTIGGVINNDLQRNSRLGVTFAVPLARRHGLKFNVSKGAYTTLGADFNAFGVAYQYTWGGGL